MAAIPLVESVQIPSQSTERTPPVHIQLPQAAHHNQLTPELNNSNGEGRSPTKNTLNHSPRQKKRYFRLLTSLRSRKFDDRYSKIIKINLDKHPRGYPRTAVFTNSDGDSSFFRRFGDLYARTLLYKQAELTELEEKLAKIDQDDNQEPGSRWKVGYSIHVKDGRKNEIRRDLMIEIKEKLKDYGDLLLQDSELRRLHRPSSRNFGNFFNWVFTENPFGPGEQNFLYHKDDFVSLDECENNWLDEKVTHLINLLNKKHLRRIFSSSIDLGKTTNPYVQYHSAQRLRILVKIIIAIASTALLLVPIFIFLSANLSAIRMTGITLLFAFFFASAISFFTNAKRQDVFAVTAAYCAVLVVFIGNLQQRQFSQ